MIKVFLKLTKFMYHFAFDKYNLNINILFLIKS